MVPGQPRAAGGRKGVRGRTPRRRPLAPANPPRSRGPGPSCALRASSRGRGRGAPNGHPSAPPRSLSSRGPDERRGRSKARKLEDLAERRRKLLELYYAGQLSAELFARGGGAAEPADRGGPSRKGGARGRADPAVRGGCQVRGGGPHPPGDGRRPTVG